MSPHHALPRLAACSGIALALLLPMAAAAGTAAPAINPITEGFRYNPAPDPETLPLIVLPPTSAASRSRKRLEDPAARLPEVAIDPAAPTVPPAPAPSAPPATPAETFVLPKLTVTGEKEKAPPLPRLHVDAPVKDLPTPEWESPEGRRARLVQKHFTALEQKLHSREYLEARAAHKEAIESAALQLNRIATAIDLSALFGLEDPAAQKELEAEFLRAFYDRPR